MTERHIPGKAKERAIKAELLQDPEYRAAWDAFQTALGRATETIAEGGRPDSTEAAEAGRAIFQLLDRRPDLVALIELAE